MSALHEEDFYSWCQEQAKNLSEKNFHKLDIQHLVEEIQDVGESLARELESCLRILFLHILKWKYQPAFRSKSWEFSIKEHRRRVKRRLNKTPSLKARIDELAKDAYEDSTFEASQETGLDHKHFPESQFFTIEQALEDEWLP